MLEKLRNHVKYLMTSRSLRNNDEVYLFITLEMAAGFMAVMHFGLLLLYGLARQGPLGGINLLCAVVMLVALVCARSGRYYYVAGTIMTLALLAYGVYSHYLSGFNTFNIMYILLGIACLMLIPYAPKSHRGIVGLGYIAAGVWLAATSFSPPAPQYTLSGKSLAALGVYNVLVGMLGVAFVLAVVSTTKRVVASQTEDKLGDMINQANSDTLTGLYNRRYAHIYFDNLLHTPAGEVWCVAMLDVDDFKHLNDEYGHLAGDKVLSGLAEIMRQVLRSTDSIFRWGGEEFLLVLRGTSLKNATMVLERMLKTIEDTPIDADGIPLHITATVGVTVLDLRDIQTSIDRCDARLYIGKRNGKNQVVSTG